MDKLWKCIFGPQLSRIYRGEEAAGRQYSPNLVELCSNGVIQSLKVVWSIGVYTSPLIVTVLYKKDFFTRERISYMLKYSFIFGVLFMGPFLIRGLGRYTNKDYTDFLYALTNAKANFCQETKKQLARYDFSFWAWPSEFNLSQVEGESKKPKRISQTSKRTTIFEKIKALPCQLISYAVAHTIGRRLLYPGSLQLLQHAIQPMLLYGRVRLIEELNGERFKLTTVDNNDIDVVFVDRRGHNDYQNGDMLVVCCEGNAGFYEMGIMDTPLKANFSVLGWNHPGFGGSTGEPFPHQEQNAMDTVMQFAIHRLGFSIDRIVLYAWSIGGFTASWASVVYPSVHSVILDATFDDLLPLALAQMPRSWSPIVVRTIRDYLNLNVADQLCKYKGPVLLIRRSKDEVITTGDSSAIETNRGNFLLIKLLQNRYPNILNNDTLNLLKRWLACDHNDQMLLWRQYDISEDWCENQLTYSQEIYELPSSIGINMTVEQKRQIILFLAAKHMRDFDSTHCQPLPADMFVLPWRPTKIMPNK